MILYSRFAPPSLSPPQEHAFRPAVYAQTLESLEPGLSAKGMRAALASLGSQLESRTIIHDEDDIPRKAAVSSKAPCHLSLPGLCPRRTPDIFEAGVRFVASIDKYISKPWDAGAFLRFRPCADDGTCLGDVHVMVGWVFRRAPRQIVFLLAEESADGGNLTFSATGGVPICLTASELAVRLVTVGCASVSVKMLSVRHCVDSWGNVVVPPDTGKEEEVIVWSQDGTHAGGHAAPVSTSKTAVQDCLIS